MEIEQLNDKLSRQMISGENATISQLLLKKGAVVPRHSHMNEQYSWIISGALKFVFDDREILVGAGEILLIPPMWPIRPWRWRTPWTSIFSHRAAKTGSARTIPTFASRLAAAGVRLETLRPGAHLTTMGRKLALIPRGTCRYNRWMVLCAAHSLARPE